MENVTFLENLTFLVLKHFSVKKGVKNIGVNKF